MLTHGCFIQLNRYFGALKSPLRSKYVGQLLNYKTSIVGSVVDCSPPSQGAKIRFRRMKLFATFRS